jgi:polysaccharide biosynthesis transport protein
MNPCSDKEATVDGIQAYKGDAATPSPSRPPIALSPVASNPAAVKTTSNYLTALKRRFWVVLAVAVPLAVTTSILVLRQPPVYVAKVEIEIKPPELDQWLTTLVATESGRRDASSQANYVANQEVKLRGRPLADRVVSDPTIAPKVGQYADAAFELIMHPLAVLQVKHTNTFFVSLEGTDPALTKELLECLLREFKDQTTEENSRTLVATKDYAEENLKKLTTTLKELDERIMTMIGKSRTLGPGGRSILEEQYVNLGTLVSQKQLRLGEIHQQMLAAQFFPKFEPDREAEVREGKLAQLKLDKHKFELILEKMRRDIRPGRFNSDPAVIEAAGALDGIIDEIQELSSIKQKTASAGNPSEMILEQYRGELDVDKEDLAKILAQMRESIPEHQEVLTLLRDREEKAKQKTKMEDKLNEFGIVREALLNSECVHIPASVPEPTVPKGNKAMLIALGLFASFGLGISLVCLLEHIDHSVKVPEHVTHGLTLPLLGVVPRIRRTALTHRGGHLWTPGTPDSIEADAYRNVRASLLGIADKRGPIVTLLITSAKAGEGKSTTALNLAATCARAGERTLLLDVDLRRPSLADVFVEPDTEGEVHGLVDVLRGELPWQRTVRHTEIPNLDFIPTGDTHDIPIEILGTLELRQLLVALEHHYDRVILDGPAVLGLADCRVLGRIVDASLLVVRSGAHHLMTLHRAKAMLEQSHVAIAGVVFNGLTHDMNNWSSYGYDPLPLSGGRSRAMSPDPEPLALAASER